MIDIGFDPEAARQALVSSNGNFEGAVEILLHQKPTGKSDSSKIQERLKNLGISGRNAEKAEKLLSAASSMGMSFLNKAKTMVKDSSKKLSEMTAAKSTIRSNNFGDDDYNEQYQRYEDYEPSANAPSSRVPSFNNVSRPEPIPTKPQPPPRPTRTILLVQASADQLSQSERLKEQGNLLGSMHPFDLRRCHSV